MNNYQHKDKLLENIDICMEQDYFSFNNKYCVETRRLLMGSALSPSVTEIYFNNFETTVFIIRIKINKWVRYVDDVLIIWDRGLHPVKKFIEELNKAKIEIQ